MQKSKIFSFFLITNYYLLITARLSPVFAQVTGQSMPRPNVTTVKDTAAASSTNLFDELVGTNFFQMDFGTFLSRAIDAVIIVGGLAVLLFLVWGAIDWLVSEGDKEKMSSAKGKITNAVIGLAILVAVWAIWQLLLQFFGLSKVFNPGA